MTPQRDVFAEARERYTILDLWSHLGLPGEPPRPGTKFCSPFRPDRNPSCDISKCGRWFADRSLGLYLDPIAFIRHTLDCDWLEVRLWLIGALGFKLPSGGKSVSRPELPKVPKQIQWPGQLSKGGQQTWRAFAEAKLIPSQAVRALVGCGLLRFIEIDGAPCFAITDEANRAGEIRRIDGGLFPTGLKMYPLPGVTKSWPVGADLLKQANRQHPSLLLCEGPSDMLAAWGAYWRYREAGGNKPWLIMGLLGAGCKKLDPELVPWFRGKTARLVPDGDDAGQRMGEHWSKLLVNHACTVDLVKLPEGRDLRDLLESSELEPRELFG